MKKYETIKKKEEFNAIIKNSSFKKNNYFVIYIRKSDYNYPRFGIAISKKVGIAVVRNKLKRQVREIITNNKEFFSKQQDYIIMIKKSCLSINYQLMNKELINLLKETYEN